MSVAELRNYLQGDTQGVSRETPLCLVNFDITAKAFAEASQPKQRGLYLVATAVIGA
jgi:hypothetical protein